MSSTVSVWSTRITSCSMIGPSSRFGRDEMAGGADQLHPVARTPAGRAGRRRRTAGSRGGCSRSGRRSAAEARRQDLHVAREHDQLHLLRLEQRARSSRRPAPCASAGTGTWWNGTPSRSTSSRASSWFETTPRRSKRSSPVRQRCSRSARQWPSRLTRISDALGYARVADGELHLVPARERQEAAAELLDAEGQRVGGHHVAHEEAVRVRVRVVADLGQPAAPGGDEPADRSHEPDRIRTGDRQDVVAIVAAAHDVECMRPVPS